MDPVAPPAAPPDASPDDPTNVVRPSEVRPSDVRPYLLTGGRTAPAVDLPVETVVRATPAGRDRRWPAGDIRGRIVGLCAGRLSVAEVAACADLALGVARVLVGDLLDAGMLVADATLDADPAAGPGADPAAGHDPGHALRHRRELMGRTLRGLRSLH